MARVPRGRISTRSPGPLTMTSRSPYQPSMPLQGTLYQPLTMTVSGVCVEDRAYPVRRTSITCSTPSASLRLRFSGRGPHLRRPLVRHDFFSEQLAGILLPHPHQDLPCP